jgi:hypothetical protein
MKYADGAAYSDPKKHYFFQNASDFKSRAPAGPIFHRLCPVAPASQKNKIGLIADKHVS